MMNAIICAAGICAAGFVIGFTFGISWTSFGLCCAIAVVVFLINAFPSHDS